MKFRCPTFPRLHVHGAGRFVDGVLEVDGEDALARIARVADRYGITAVADRTDPFDPAAHGVDVVLAYLDTAGPYERARVLVAERAGKARVTVLRAGEGSGTPAAPPETTGEPAAPDGAGAAAADG